MTTTALDDLVSDPRLQPVARAVLLLRVCVVAQALRPDVVQRYWEDLKAVSRHLPASSRESYEGLRYTLEPLPPASLGGLAGKIADELAAANASGDRDAMLAALRDAERRIKRRPFGKKPAWDVLVRAWIDADRAGGFTHLHRLPRAVQTNLLIRENDRSALEAREWDSVYKQVPAAVHAAVRELLDRDDPRLDLSAEVAEAVGASLAIATLQGGVDDTAAERQRDKARDRHVKLVEVTLKRSPDVAGRLLEQRFRATVEMDFYAENWPGRFFALFRLVALWSSSPELEPGLAAYVTSDAPAHLRDAVLAHAAGLKPTTADEADAAWAALEPRLTDKGPAEHWFLLTLLRAGQPRHALEMAHRSPRAQKIVPCLRRAWLYEQPETARGAVEPADVAGDEIAEFLVRDRDGRVEFLREHTQSGQSSLPVALWKAPSVSDLARDISGDDGERETPREAVGSWYRKNEPAENQFAVFVRINGYGQHLYENLDPILLQTLVAWDDADPDDVGAVTKRMWRTMQAEIKPMTLRLDLLRNSIFERCQGALGAHPATVDEFAHWIRSELVEKTVQERVGDTIHTFQLNENAPFLYALLAAQKVAGASARRCDEVVKNAIRKYTASDELLMAAAQLYASDKGLAGLDPPAPLKQSAQLGAWQLGVVETAVKDIIAALLPKEDATPT